MSKFEIKCLNWAKVSTRRQWPWSGRSKREMLFRKMKYCLASKSTAKVKCKIPLTVAGTLGGNSRVQEGETAPWGAVVALVLLEGETDDSVSQMTRIQLIRGRQSQFCPTEGSPMADRSPVVYQLFASGKWARRIMIDRLNRNRTDLGNPSK